MLLISEDLDEIRALADRIVVIYEGELTGVVRPGDARRSRRSGWRWPEASARDHVRAPPRSRRWLGVAVPLGSIAFAFVVMAVVLVITGHDPIDTYRRLFKAAFAGDAAWTATLQTATPLLFTGLCAAVAFRMNLFNIGGEGQLYLGALCSLGIAIWIGPDHWTGTTIFADVRLRRGGRRALGADRRRAEGVRPDERDHRHADAQLRRGAAADVPDLRQRLAVARRLDDPDALVPAVDRAEGQPVLAAVASVGRRRARSGSCSGSGSRSRCGSSSAGRGSGSR